MSGQYHYLIASLPEYAFDTDNARIDVPALRAEIKSEISRKDQLAVELLYTYYDIENVIIYLKGSKTPFNMLGNLDPAQIKAEVDGTTASEDDQVTVSLLPSDIRLAIDRHKGRIDLENQDPDEKPETVEIEHRLYSDFYKLCRRSHSKFLREWSDIDRIIRNIITVSRARSMGLDPDKMIIGNGPLEKQLLESQSADFGLKDDFRYTEDLLQVLETTDFVARERKMDVLRWNIATELSQFDYFNISVILDYLIKLNILYRWESLDKQEGRDRFRLIVENLTEIDTDRD